MKRKVFKAATGMKSVEELTMEELEGFRAAIDAEFIRRLEQMHAALAKAGIEEAALAAFRRENIPKGKRKRKGAGWGI